MYPSQDLKLSDLIKEVFKEMKKEVIQVKYSGERLRAIRSQMAKKGVKFEDEINDVIDGIYKKYVKPEVREFIEEAERMVESKSNRS